MKKRLTPEERVATNLVNLVRDLTLDLDEVGKQMAINSPTVLVNRLEVIVEVAREEKEERSVRLHHI